MMATHMDPDSEVIFKEKEEEKGIKEAGTIETAGQDATIRFDFRASTPAIPVAPQPERGTEGRAGEGEEHRRVKLRNFSLRPQKFDGKVDFEGWVNQFEEYAVLGQWSDEDRASLIFLSLTG